MIARRGIQDRYCHIASMLQRANLVATYTMILKKEYQIAIHPKDHRKYRYDRTSTHHSRQSVTK